MLWQSLWTGHYEYSPASLSPSLFGCSAKLLAMDASEHPPQGESGAATEGGYFWSSSRGQQVQRFVFFSRYFLGQKRYQLSHVCYLYERRRNSSTVHVHCEELLECGRLSYTLIMLIHQLIDHAPPFIHRSSPTTIAATTFNDFLRLYPKAYFNIQKQISCPNLGQMRRLHKWSDSAQHNLSSWTDSSGFPYSW